MEKPDEPRSLTLANPDKAVAAFEGKRGAMLWAVSAADGMFYENDDGVFAKGPLTLDFVCFTCHDGEKAFLMDDLETAAAAAERIH